jgi:hypothetical protein
MTQCLLLNYYSILTHCLGEPLACFFNVRRSDVPMSLVGQILLGCRGLVCWLVVQFHHLEK